MKALLFSQKLKQDDFEFLKSIVDKLNREDIDIYFHESYPSDVSKQFITMHHLKEINNSKEMVENKIDYIITLGGDGTILRACAFCQGAEIPIVGVNLGRLGFLSNIEKSKVFEAINRIKNKDYSLESRSMIKLECNIPLFIDYAHALNDFTMHKRDTSSMMAIHTYINDGYLNTYWADGIIVSTPTGSTGYSLACGGPIIFPDSENLVITPIAPHNLNVRPLIINDDVKISFEIEGRADNYLCTLDSRYETITEDYKITLRKSPITTKLVNFEDHNFMKTIRDKLLWGLDRRN